MRRRVLFTAATALVPVLFFVLLEAGLRGVGYGKSYPLFIDVPGSGEWRTTNRDVARRYFAAHASVPNAIGDAWKSRKDSTTFRIVVQGGSSAAGYPYYYGGSFSRMLAQRLQQTFPGRRIEVVNTAMAAVNSYTLLDFADEILEIEPDAVLIYAGHNEFYGALGVGSTESIGRFRGLVNLYLRLQDWRTLQAVRALLGEAAALFSGGAPDSRPGYTLMERMVGEQRIPYGSALYRMGLAQFEGNLEDLISGYREAGVPVLISTLASNERDHAPFESAPAEGTDPEGWRARLAEAGLLEARGDTSGALEAYRRLAATDSIDADVRFAEGRLLDGSGRQDEARAAYLSAKDRDQLRFRASEDMNGIIRDVARRQGAIVVDGQAALRAASPGGIIDASLMLEHLHPNLDGYFLLSDAFYEALLEHGLPEAAARPIPAREARQELLVTAIDSLFGSYRVRQLLGSWPFRAPGTFDTSMDTVTARTTSETLALGLFREELSWYEATDRLRDAYMTVGDYHRALRAALTLIQQYPFLAAPYAYAGEALLRQRRGQEALFYYGAAVGIEESAVVRMVMGDLHAAMSAPRAAVSEYERAARLAPADVDIALKLARAYAMAGRLDAAEQTLVALLSRIPGEPRATRALESLSAVVRGEPPRGD